MEDEKQDLDKFKKFGQDLTDWFGKLVNADGDLMNMGDASPAPNPKGRPQVKLMGLQFQYGDSTPEEGGIPLTTMGSSWQPGDRSTAVYSIRSTAEAIQKGKLKVWARFWNSHGKGKIRVRSQVAITHLLDVITNEVQGQELGRDALGSAAPTTIFFDQSGYSVFRGKHSYVPLKLEDVKFPELGVGVYDIQWFWEFTVVDEEETERKGKTVWKNEEEDWTGIRISNSTIPIELSAGFEQTQHRIYVTLDVPGPPWSVHRVPDMSKGLPVSMPMWSHALELACRYASQAQDEYNIALRIASEINALGLFVYDPSPQYCSLAKKDTNFGGVDLEEQEGSYIAYFQFDKFVERLWGGKGLGPNINCFDAALGVATLANMLGCKLRVGKLQNMADIDSTDDSHYEDNRFEINPILPVGYLDPNMPVPGVNREDGNFFAYHSVAWSAAHGGYGTPEDFLDPNNLIFDASLSFIQDGQYWSGSGLRLGHSNYPGSYVQWLAAATPMGMPRCKPQPITVVDVQITG